MVDYSVESGTTTQHSGWANLMSSIPRKPTEKMLKRDEGISRAGRRTLWRPEQKSVSSMNDLVQKFSRPGDVTMSFWAGTCFTAKACMLLSQHRKFVRSEVDSKLLTAAEADVLLKFAS